MQLAGPVTHRIALCALILLGFAAGSRRWPALLHAAGRLPAATRPEPTPSKAEAELQSVKSEIERITRQVSERPGRARPADPASCASAELSVGKARESLEGVRHERAEQRRAPRRAGRRKTRRAGDHCERPRRARRTAARRLSDRPRGAAEAAAQSEGSRPRRPDVRLLQLFRAGTRAADPCHRRRCAAPSDELDSRARSGGRRSLRSWKSSSARSSRTSSRRARAARACSRTWRRSPTPARRASSGCSASRAGWRSCCTNCGEAMADIPGRQQRCVRAPARQARLAGAAAARGALRRYARRRREMGRRAVATERGAPVRAVYQGRVIYADWLPGLGCSPSSTTATAT